MLFILILLIWGVKAWLLPMIPEEHIEIGPVERTLLEMHVKDVEASEQIGRFRERSDTRALNLVGQFNPNQVELEQLLGMGFPIKVARTWTNYVRSGGRFHQPDDLLRIYGFRKEWLNLMEGHLTLIGDTLQQKESSSSIKLELIRVELNSADSTLLVSLPGIGSKLALRIIKYRNILGGYHDLQQLLDVYGLDTAVYGKVLTRLYVDTAVISVLDVNSCDFQTLNRHPCIPRDLAYDIIEYRGKHGEIRQLNQLEAYNRLPSIQRQRLHCYLSVESEKGGGGNIGINK